MAFSWADFADIVEGRARRIGLPDDVGDLLMTAYGCLQQLVDIYDLAAYTVHNDAMWRSEAGQHAYRLPDDFGRLLHIHQQARVSFGGTGASGVFVAGGTLTTPRPLRYCEPMPFFQGRSTTNGTPFQFTLSQRQILLDPPPDTNAGSHYTGRGVYIARVTRPDMDLGDPILLDEPSALVAMTLAQLAGDRGLPQAGSLGQEYQRLLSALVTNQHRLRQQFYQQRAPGRR